MKNFTTENQHQQALNFLQQTPKQRHILLKELGIARYEFLTKIPLNPANIACVIRFLENPATLKFPNLSNAELSNLNLNEINFIRGNLTNTNLQNTSLINADLIFANLTNANLTNADLQGATLNETIWLNTIVTNCKLGTGIGLTNSQRQNLQLRGAIFSTEETK